MSADAVSFLDDMTEELERLRRVESRLLELIEAERWLCGKGDCSADYRSDMQLAAEYALGIPSGGYEENRTECANLVKRYREATQVRQDAGA